MEYAAVGGFLKEPSELFKLDDSGIEITGTEDSVEYWETYFETDAWKYHLESSAPLESLFSGAYTSSQFGDTEKGYLIELEKLSDRLPVRTAKVPAEIYAR